jgi:hypothetical protein
MNMGISGNYLNPSGNYGYNAGAAGAASSNGAAANEDIQFSNYQSTSGPAQAQNPEGTEQKTSGEQQKPNGLRGFFQGMWNGAKNAVKSLFTPKGLLLAGAGLAACIAFPLAAPLILGGAAIGMGAYQAYKGHKNGDAEQMGEGSFNMISGFLGGIYSAPMGTRAYIATSDGIKPTLSAGPKANVANVWNYAKGNNIPPGTTPPGAFTRTGQVLLGRAPGMESNPAGSIISSATITGADRGMKESEQTA